MTRDMNNGALHDLAESGRLAGTSCDSETRSRTGRHDFQSEAKTRFGTANFLGPAKSQTILACPDFRTPSGRTTVARSWSSLSHRFGGGGARKPVRGNGDRLVSGRLGSDARAVSQASVLSERCI
jgi:hypothetical protein